MKLLNQANTWADALMKNAHIAALAVTLATAAGATLAGPGHDHGDEAPAASGTASPRVTSHADLFELVGIVDAGVFSVDACSDDVAFDHIVGSRNATDRDTSFSITRNNVSQGD